MAQRKMVLLQACAGQDEANFGEERFPVNLDTNTVLVPQEAVASLIEVGGFSQDPPVVELDPGLVRVVGPDGGGCSWGGSSYEPAEDGSVTVPVAAVGDLTAHGFTVFVAPAKA